MAGDFDPSEAAAAARAEPAALRVVRLKGLSPPALGARAPGTVSDGFSQELRSHAAAPCAKVPPAAARSRAAAAAFPLPPP